MRPARTREEVEQALLLRERVFGGEQRVPRAADRDGRDAQATHVVALDAGAVVGTCRVLLGGRAARLGRMAVERARRGRGIGTALLAEAESVAGAAGAARVRLHAQTSARSLYARAGYRDDGDRFVEEGIEHVAMEKRLA